MKADLVSFVQVLGFRSETWLYRQLVSPTEHHALVCTHKHINRRDYPYSRVYTSAALGRRLLNRCRCLLGMPRWGWIQNHRRLFSRVVSLPQVQLIQAHFGWTGYGAWDLARHVPKPYLVWLYGSDVFRNGPCRHRELPCLFRTRASFACTSQALRGEAIRLGCDPARITVVYPGVPVPAYQPRDPRCSGRPRILSAGRLVGSKDPLGLVRVASCLKDIGIAFQWQHFGDGPMRPAVELGIAESGIRDNFTLEGEVANDSVLAAMRAANAMVHIAQIAPDGGRESFGVVLAEAAASGLPVIASRLGGIPEIVEDLTTGFLVEPGAYPEMAEHAAALLSNPALADRLGRQAHERASRCFNAEVQARQLDSFYDRLIAQSCGNSGSGCPPGFAST